MRLIGLKHADLLDICTALSHHLTASTNAHYTACDKLNRQFRSVEFPRNTENVNICISEDELRILEYVVRRYQVLKDPAFKHLADHLKYLMLNGIT